MLMKNFFKLRGDPGFFHWKPRLSPRKIALVSDPRTRGSRRNAQLHVNITLDYMYMYIYNYIYPIGSMYAIYGNIYDQYTPNVSINTIHGSYGYIYIHKSILSTYVISLATVTFFSLDPHVSWLNPKSGLDRSMIFS